METPLAMPLVSERPILSQEECQKFIELFNDETLIENANQSDIRIVDHIYVHNLQCVKETIEKVVSNLNEINQMAYKFVLDKVQQIEVGRYGIGGKYDWHQDTSELSGERCRKLSFSINLNDNFDGGDLEFTDKKYNSPTGHMTVFPSFMTHRVRAVTSGVRYAMFGWVEGPRFK